MQQATVPAAEKKAAVNKIKNYTMFIFEKIMQFFQGEGIKGLPLAILILLMFVSGVRGVFAYHRYSKNKLSTESA